LKMEIGKGVRDHGTALSVFSFLFSLFLFLCAAGCASPGEPIERRPPTPAAIADLAAHQAGNAVVLTFTLPHETVQHRPLKQPPEIEILRSISAAPSASPSAASGAPAQIPSPLVTIPSSMVSHYAEQDHIRYTDQLQATDFSQSPNEVATYIIRTRASEKTFSPDSNLASIAIYPSPEPIDDLKAEVTRDSSGVMLTWTAPQKTPIGSAPAIQGYRIFRMEVSGPVAQASATQSQPAASTSSEAPIKLKQQFMQIAETQTPGFEDMKAEFGKTYTYSVRSVVEYSSEKLESGDSNSATVTVRDIYPPSAPQGLVVVFVPALSGTPAHLELSWAINPETDTAGYNVYRSEQQGTLGARLNPELLLTPAFRDMSAVAGRKYFYEVTAVDRSGNESSPSAPMAAEMPPESQQP
jgi:hypothetical protein